MAHAPHYQEAAQYAPPRIPTPARSPRKTTRARIFHSAAAGPETAARKPLVTPGSVLLLVLMLGLAMYATGRLPQLDTLFDSVMAYSRGHNAEAVVAILTWFPALLLGFAILALGLFFFSAVQKRRADRHVRPLAQRRFAARQPAAGERPAAPEAAPTDAPREEAATQAEAAGKALLAARSQTTARALAVARAEAEARAEAMVRAAAADRAATSILLRHPHVPRGVSTDDSLGGAPASERIKRLYRQPSIDPPVFSQAEAKAAGSLSKP